MKVTIDERPHGMVVIPAGEVLPGEPRWWCEDDEEPGDDASHIDLDQLHTDSRAAMACERSKYAIVHRPVVRADLLTPEAHAMLHDSVACLVGMLGDGEPVYALTEARKGRLRLTLDVTFDAAAMCRFADAVGGHPSVAIEDRPLPTSVRAGDAQEGT